MTTTSWDDLMASLGLEPSTRPRCGPTAVAECGTPAGSDRHYRLGEKPCDPCRIAKNAANTRWRRAKQLANGCPPRPPAECGTLRGFRAHRWRKEQPCEPCRLAYNAWQAECRAAA
ncbi:hypothetical protein [Streptomyces enissocaesilis]|uniref:Uncharacterized protein n=1 Tax=Streptomyces enissocaesilis TaxID=332589 RepID=A0ABN3WVN7_9ACTN